VASKLESFTKVTTELVNQYDQALKRIDELSNLVCPAVQTLHDLPKFDMIQVMSHFQVKGVHEDWMSVEFGYSKYHNIATTKEQLDSMLNHVIENVVHVKMKQATEIHALNIPIIEHNKLVRNSIYKTMEVAGIPQSYKVYETRSPRHKNKEWVTKTAGWVTDLNRECKIEDGFTVLIKQYNDYLKSLKDFHQAAVRSVDKYQRDRQLTERKSKEQRELATLNAIYLPDDLSASVQDIIIELTSRDKYLNLAHAMEATRGDWSDGFYRVEIALGEFTIETELDQKIYDCVSGLMDQEDGRVFRDCKYDYGAVYSYVQDETLLKHLQILQTML